MRVRPMEIQGNSYRRTRRSHPGAGSVLRNKRAPVEAVKSDLPAPSLLIIDDDPTILNLLARLYIESGYSVTAVLCAEEAFARLAEADFDLVISDVHLPGETGVKLTSYVRDRFPNVPVIVITGASETQTAVDVLKMGALDYLIKPFDFAALLEMTRGSFGKNHRLSRNPPPPPAPE